MVERAEAVRTAISVHESELARFIERRCGGLLDPQDILQSAAVRALSKAHQLAEPAHVRAWLFRIVRNLMADELRRLGVGPILDDIDEMDLSIRPEDESPCWCVLAQSETLKPEYSEILRRVVIDGAPVTQVAGDLGLTPNNAMVRLHRARTALRRRMAEHCGTTTFRSCTDCGCAERGCCPAPS